MATKRRTATTRKPAPAPKPAAPKAAPVASAAPKPALAPKAAEAPKASPAADAGAPAPAERKKSETGHFIPPAQETQTRAVPAPAAPERKFEVLEEAEVPRKGGTPYTLPKGKVISSFGYPIGLLESMGVKLKEVTEAAPAG